MTSPRFLLPIPRVFWGFHQQPPLPGTQSHGCVRQKPQQFLLGGCCGARAIPAHPRDHFTPVLETPLGAFFPEAPC